MSSSPRFTLRPFTRQTRSDQRDALRLHFTPAAQVLVKAGAGDLCRVDDGSGVIRHAIAWSSLEKMKESVVQASRTYQAIFGLKYGDNITVTRDPDGLQDAAKVYFEEAECPTAAPEQQAELSQQLEKKQQWERALEQPVRKCEIVAAGLQFEVALRGSKKRFKIRRVAGPPGLTTPHTVLRCTDQTKFAIGDDDDGGGGGGGGGSDAEPPITLRIEPSSLGGLHAQISLINDRLRDYDNQYQGLKMPSFYNSSGGILLYGPKGTGKSALLSCIKEAKWRRVLTISTSVLSRSAAGEESVRKAFSEALQLQPSVILIDQLNFVAPKRESSNESSTIAPVLCELMDSIQDAKVLVVAAARVPNQVDDSLRTPHRFGIELELPVPTAADRLEILKAIRNGDPQPPDELLSGMAERTHGYVGADLFSLLQLACRKAFTRQTRDQALEKDGSSEGRALVIEEEDMFAAMQDIRPTAMREVYLETPNIRWSDIGGQHAVKQNLRKAVERPIKFADRMKRLNIHAKKGILLYGPPGCSKTLLVKALAREAGLNFLAVKGAEILSMYVGESERSVREIFRKARSASPSIIFFDEIDAVAAKRGGSQNGGVNVLTTLLNELDGIEELRNVLVVAATNKPEVLDPALMRPGRLDNLVYIGPPDYEARKEIIRKWASKSVVDGDVDVNELAARTEGHSGAEMVSICEHAADAAMDEEEATSVPGSVKRAHFEAALGQVQRQISPHVVRDYVRWSETMGIPKFWKDELVFR